MKMETYSTVPVPASKWGRDIQGKRIVNTAGEPMRIGMSQLAMWHIKCDLPEDATMQTIVDSKRAMRKMEEVLRRYAAGTLAYDEDVAYE